MKMSKVIAIVGPTASGKTGLAIEIARALDGEIVSADSRQIYRGMDIGTAKPISEELDTVPHHLIDIKDPDEEYTVADYKKDAIATIENILERDKIPVVAGGTGLYLKATLENLDIPRVSSDPELRAKLEKDIAEQGLPAVFERLVALDPEAEHVVDAKNPRRVVRALEVALLTGEPFTAQRKKNAPLFDALTIGLDIEPGELRRRIDTRVEGMVAHGLIQEVKKMIEKYGKDTVAFDTIGYREIIDFLDGKISQDEAVAAIKMNTWHYAKRQMTWFRKDKSVQWIKDPKETLPLAKRFLEK